MKVLIAAGLLKASTALVDVVTAMSFGERVNLLLNILVFAAAVVVAVPWLRSKRKDGVIRELEEVVDTKDRLIVSLRDDIKGVAQRADQLAERVTSCERAAAEWQARYEEQSKYTAREAFTHFEQIMSQHSNQVAERHAAMLDVLNTLTRSHSDLIVKLSGLVARVGDSLPSSDGEPETSGA